MKGKFMFIINGNIYTMADKNIENGYISIQKGKIVKDNIKEFLIKRPKKKKEIINL